MAYDPTKPADGSQISAGELRGQFAGLKDLIDAKANTADLTAAIQAESSGPTQGQIDYFTGTFSAPPTQAEVQALADHYNTLLALLRRV